MPYIRVPKLSGPHPLVLNDAVHVRLLWNFNGRLGCNVLGGRVGGGFINSQTHANDLATAVLASFTSSGLKALTSDTVELQGVGIRDLRSANQVEYTQTSAPVAGTGAANPMPTQLAAVVTLRTDLAGKSYRGRVYIGGADEDQNDGTGRIAGAYNTAIVAFITAVKADMAAEGITLAIISAPRYANLPPPADIQTWAGDLTDVTAQVARDTHWDSQNRRDS